MAAVSGKLLPCRFADAPNEWWAFISIILFMSIMLIILVICSIVGTPAYCAGCFDAPDYSKIKQ